MKRIDELQREVDKLWDFIRWPSIDHRNEAFKNWITRLSRNEAEKAIDDRQFGCEVTREDFDLLLNHLGLEMRDGKYIVKKTQKKGRR